MKIELSKKLFVLKQIYKIYDDFNDTLDVACKIYCSQCCTNDVIMTTLEGQLIIEYVLESEPFEWLKKVEKGLSKKRFLPQTTTNKIAELCRKGKELPREDHSCAEDICPLLADDECPIYTVRPFGCRCLVSTHDCRPTGYASVDSFVLSANHLFLQFIEHVDANGFSGNLTDVLWFMASKDNRIGYETDTLKDAEIILKSKLISNLPMKVLMVPPEHRIQIQPILDALNNIKIPPDKTNDM